MKKMIFLLGILIPMLFINPAFAQVAQSPFSYHLYIDGIDGDSMEKPSGPGLPRPIDILSFKEGVTQTGAVATAAGRGAGRVQFADLSVTKRMDRASVRLKSACASGQHFKRVFLTCMFAGKSQQEIYRLTLGDVMVTGVKSNGDQLGVLEEVTFNYGQIEWQYTPVGVPPIKGSYDLHRVIK